VKSLADILNEHGLPLPPPGVTRYYSSCPRCSASRKSTHRKSKCLGINITSDGVNFGCSHCGWTGGGYFNGRGRESDAIINWYDYTGESGTVLFQKVRTAAKRFWQRRPDGKGGWINGLKDVRKVLYRLPGVIEAIGNNQIVVCVEGEKDVDNLWKIGVPATCSPDGAAKPGQQLKWRLEYSELLRGGDIVVVPDHDPAGYAHAEATAEGLQGFAQRVRVLKLADYWPECPEGGDISDWLAVGGTVERLWGIIAELPEWTRRPKERDAPKPEIKPPASAALLMTMQFAPIEYVVPGIIVEGLSLFAGKPKLGKSWCLLHAAIAVARGGFTLGEIHCVEGDALYAALEDNFRRLQTRIRKLIGSQPPPNRLFLTCEMPRLTEGGIEYIRNWITSASQPRLVVIDTLAMVRAPKQREESSYDADYRAVQELRTLANRHGVAIVLVHHLRKAEADDAFDTVSGTLALTGAPDTVLVLRRESNGNVVLHGRGRDLAEIEKAMQFNKDACTWTIVGDASEARISAERKAVLAALEEVGSPASVADIAALAKVPNVRRMLERMANEGVAHRPERGRYTLAPVGKHSD
jgi:hypothetical protein